MEFLATQLTPVSAIAQSSEEALTTSNLRGLPRCLLLPTPLTWGTIRKIHPEPIRFPSKWKGFGSRIQASIPAWFALLPARVGAKPEFLSSTRPRIFRSWIAGETSSFACSGMSATISLSSLQGSSETSARIRSATSTRSGALAMSSRTRWKR
mgnify:CR=1 FL=1